MENNTILFTKPFDQIEDMPDFDVEETETETETEEVTEETIEETKPTAKEDKLSPHEQVILSEMERRAKAGDTQLEQGLQSKDKSIHLCYQYITSQARKQATGGCAMIEDNIVFGWAVHYYTESKETIDEEMHLKPKQKPASKPAKKVKETPKPVKNTIDLTKVITAPKPVSDGKKREKIKDNLFAGFVPMERPDVKDYKEMAKKGSRQQAKSVEQMDLFADFFAE